MRVVFNVDAITAPLTGIGHYALQLARGLAKHPEIESLKLFSAYRWVDSPETALQTNNNIAALRKNLPFKTVALEIYTQMRAGIFRWHTRRMSDHLFHTPNYVLMPFDGPSLTTIHDLSFLRYPQCHPPERIHFLNRYLPKTLDQARRIITVSDFTRKELMETFSIEESRIHIVPLGVDASFRNYSSDEIKHTLYKHKLDYKKYLLVVATLEPRKNLVALLKAYAALPIRLRSHFPLILVGARGWLTEEIHRVLIPLEQTGQIRRLGYIDQNELPGLYAGALGFAFPSLYEGFGLPVLEAMASGTPVLTSNVSSMPEVAGEDALLVNPHDVDDIRTGMERMLEDAEWRMAASARGLERAAHFSWARCVEETVAVYKKANCI